MIETWIVFVLYVATTGFLLHRGFGPITVAVTLTSVLFSIVFVLDPNLVRILFRMHDRFASIPMFTLAAAAAYAALLASQLASAPRCRVSQAVAAVLGGSALVLTKNERTSLGDLHLVAAAAFAPLGLCVLLVAIFFDQSIARLGLDVCIFVSAALAVLAYMRDDQSQDTILWSNIILLIPGAVAIGGMALGTFTPFEALTVAVAGQALFLFRPFDVDNQLPAIHAAGLAAGSAALIFLAAQVLFPAVFFAARSIASPMQPLSTDPILAFALLAGAASLLSFFGGTFVSLILTLPLFLLVQDNAVSGNVNVALLIAASEAGQQLRSWRRGAQPRGLVEFAAIALAAIVLTIP